MTHAHDSRKTKAEPAIVTEKDVSPRRTHTYTDFPTRIPLWANLAYRNEVPPSLRLPMSQPLEERESLQGRLDPIQKKENNTGLPDRLKTGIETLSGISMDDVQVHYNSPKPAPLQALAYTQGTDIHVASGQEQHLAHEAWHVVQQKQGRVRATLQARNVAINDDKGLEREANVMGEKAALLNIPAYLQQSVQSQNDLDEGGLIMKPTPIQRAVGFEFQTYQSPTKLEILKDGAWIIYNDDVEERYALGNGIKVEKDGEDLEFVTDAFPESDAGRAKLTLAMRTMVITALNLENKITLTSHISQMVSGLGSGPDAKDTIRVHSKGPMKAQPQATVGIKLDSLTPLLDALTQASMREKPKDLKTIYETEVGRPGARKASKLQHHKVLANELGKNVNDVTQQFFYEYVYSMASKFAQAFARDKSFAMNGFIHLLGLYIFGGRAKSKYAKSRTPVISRTNLADVFAKLPKNDQVWFVKEFLPQAKVYLLANGIGIDTAASIYPTYPYGEQEAVGVGELDILKLTIDAWLSNLAPKELGGTGTDVLSVLEGLGVIANINKVDNPDPTDYRQKWFSSTYGADLQMQESTDIGIRESLDQEGMNPHRVEGIILELRNLGDDQLDLSEWATFALSMFDLTLLVNSDTFKEVKALSSAMLKQRSFETDLGDVPVPGIFAQARKTLQG